MADANTPRLNLVQPEVGASASTWGFKWNNNAAILDAAITTAGGEITGSLTIDGVLGIGTSGNFYLQDQGSQRLLNWAPDWFDAWDGASGTRSWCSAAGALMTLDGAANLTVNGNFNLSGEIWTPSGTVPVIASLSVAGALSVAEGISAGGTVSGAGVYANNGRLFAQSLAGSVPSITLWNVPASIAMGCWFTTSPYDQLNWGTMDASGNGLTGCMFTRPDGTFEITGQGWKPGGGMWAAPSDVRLKKDIADYTSGLAEICALRPVSYRYNGVAGSKNDGRLHHGLIAQEVETVMPELVGTRRARLNPDDQSYADILTLDPTPAFFALINAVRELAGRVRALETAINPTGDS